MTSPDWADESARFHLHRSMYDADDEYEMCIESLVESLRFAEQRGYERGKAEAGEAATIHGFETMRRILLSWLTWHKAEFEKSGLEFVADSTFHTYAPYPMNKRQTEAWIAAIENVQESLRKARADGLREAAEIVWSDADNYKDPYDGYFLVGELCSDLRARADAVEKGEG